MTSPDSFVMLLITIIIFIIVKHCPEEVKGVRTLKHSRQRESIKNCLMQRTDHPTADMLYLSIREEFPNISLGTVYRNLKLLSELGEITRFSCGDGSEHFDYRTEPHYHFICKTCGAVYDMPAEIVRDTSELLTAQPPGRVDSHTVFFYGECKTCQQKKS